MERQQNRNIVWFCTDQQRYNTIAALGNSEFPTPNLDRLVREGTAFTRAYTQSPVCTPSRASFLTGRYPKSTRASYNGNECFSLDEVLVTKTFADGGYACGLTGKLHLTAAQRDEERRADDGYSNFQWSHHPHDDWPKGGNQYQEWLKGKGLKWADIYGGKYLSMSSWPPNPTPGFSGKEVGPAPENHQTTWCVEAAMEFIDECGDKPWLVSINPFDPHPPLDPPQAYKDKLDPSSLALPVWQDGEHDNKPPHYLKDYIQGGQNGAADTVVGMSDDLKRELRRDYYAEIMLIDDQLGRLIDFLEKKGMRENTIIVFHSDHGEMNGDHGLHWKGAYFYEEMVHVPLIFSCPGLIQQGVVSEALVELVDIAPTLLELTGRKVPERMQGKSLAGILTGAGDPRHHKDCVYTEWYASLLDSCHGDLYATMYLDDRFKVVVYHGESYGELYDMKKDPNQFNNLWDNPEYRDVKYEMIKRDFDHAILCNQDKVLGGNYGY
jgi:arylsulfatase A-like enzyme